MGIEYNFIEKCVAVGITTEIYNKSLPELPIIFFSYLIYNRSCNDT